MSIEGGMHTSESGEEKILKVTKELRDAVACVLGHGGSVPPSLSEVFGHQINDPLSKEKAAVLRVQLAESTESYKVKDGHVYFYEDEQGNLTLYHPDDEDNGLYVWGGKVWWGDDPDGPSYFKKSFTLDSLFNHN